MLKCGNDLKNVELNIVFRRENDFTTFLSHSPSKYFITYKLYLYIYFFGGTGV
jgi:hypothetical protein